MNIDRMYADDISEVNRYEKQIEYFESQLEFEWFRTIVSSTNLTRNEGININGLNFGCDKIRLSEDYRRYLLGIITKTTQFSTIENE